MPFKEAVEEKKDIKAPVSIWIKALILPCMSAVVPSE